VGGKIKAKHINGWFRYFDYQDLVSKVDERQCWNLGWMFRIYRFIL